MKTITKATPPEQMIAALMEAIRSAGMPTTSTPYFDRAGSWMTKSMTHPAATLRALRPVKPYICAQCGCGFTASDERARYCSNRCRQAAKYARLKAAKDR